MATVGRGACSRIRRSSANRAAAGGYACSAVQSVPGESRIVSAPTNTASAHARSSPITNRSAALSSLMIRLEWGWPGSATTPSSVATKFAYSRGSANPSGPP
jgi:hypothetical protein